MCGHVCPMGLFLLFVVFGCAEPKAGCGNWILQPEELRGVQTAQSKFSVLSKIIGYPNLIIAAKS